MEIATDAVDVMRGPPSRQRDIEQPFGHRQLACTLTLGVGAPPRSGPFDFIPSRHSAKESIQKFL